ncbi:MAG TPA: AAA family ATPase, partial [Allocoleopsis sp.]
GYDVLIIDSLSHAWVGKDGALEQVDRIAKRSQSNNNFTAWREVTPLHNALVEAMLSCPCDLIVTMRSKTEYVLQPNDKGKLEPKKIGLAPVQRDGIEYEFDVSGELNLDNDLIISKSRCPALTGQIIHQPGKALAHTLKTWLNEGDPAPERFDRAAVIAQIDEELARLNWTNKDGKNHLLREYGKASRQLLTDSELAEFAAYLSGQPDSIAATGKHLES